jgi:hypothetical protein
VFPDGTVSSVEGNERAQSAPQKIGGGDDK